MSEKALWSFIRENLGLRMFRVENRVSVGMPDVHYIRNGVCGWFEMKYTKDWLANRRVSVGLKKHQHLWMKDYTNHGGSCWIILRVGRNWLMLFKGDEDLVKMIKPQELIDKAIWHHQGIMKRENWKLLKEVIEDG
jgi:penicillin-binding protein-related factor A (putative recombinase)